MTSADPSPLSWSRRRPYSARGKRRLVEAVREAFRTSGPPLETTFDPDGLEPDRFDMVGVGALIKREEGDTVLITRSDFGQESLFLPGGGVEEDDASLAEACAREVREETGLVVAVESLRLARIERRLLFCHFLCRPLAGRLDARGDPDGKTTSVLLAGRVDLSRVPLPADRLMLMAERFADGDLAAARRGFRALGDAFEG